MKAVVVLMSASTALACPPPRVAAVRTDAPQLRLGLGDELAARAVIRGDAGRVFALAWSSDGKRLASAGSDLDVLVWK
jgi:WD40 repeat protein